MNQVYIPSKKSKMIIWIEGFFHMYPKLDSVGVTFPNISDVYKYTYGESFKKEEMITSIVSIEKLLPKDKFCKRGGLYKCPLCSKKSSLFWGFKNIIWTKLYIHQIKDHNVKPSRNFENFVTQFIRSVPDKKWDKIKFSDFKMHFRGELVKKNQMYYVRLTTNQLNIIDSLLYHGGMKEKYYKGNKRMHSEHAGVLVIDQSFKVSSIIISAKEGRIDKDDPTIFLPSNNDIMREYEYIFHTHPPTPRPGGRAIHGVLYELPSISDIFHYIEFYNKYKALGSIVVSAEGFYLIRPLSLNLKHIIEPPEKKLHMLYSTIQKKYIDFYGLEFSDEYFYETIAQNQEPINQINQFLKSYNIFIMFKPRVSSVNNVWIMDDIYLPILF